MLDGQKVLVAGAGGLLGSTLVRDLLGEGANVVAVDINEDQMRRRLNELGVSLSGDELLSLTCDLTKKSEVEALFSQIPGLTGAVNATYPRNSAYGAHFLDVEVQDFNENVSLHLGSTFLFCQQAAKYFLRAQGNFSLVNISSVYGVVTPRFDIYEGTSMTMPVEYAAIKSAVIHLSKYIAAYVRDSRFRVNCVSPGGIRDCQPDRFIEAYKSHTFGNGMLTVDDVTGGIIYLLSDKARHVTGQNIIVDDGFSI